MSATILRDPTLNMISDPDGTPVSHDLSCYARAVDVSQSVETIDIATMCAPTATELGSVSEEITIAFLWEPALLTAMQPYVNDEVEFQLKMNSADAEGLVWRGRYAVAPLAGRFELGSRVEVDLQVAVLTSPTYQAIT